MAEQPPFDLLDDLLLRLKKAGADAADALLVEGASLQVARRLGEIESVERAESHDLGLRVFVGRRQAIVSTGDLRPASLERLLEQAIGSARALPEDAYAGLADPEQITHDIPDLDLFDPAEPDTEALIALTAAAEDAARAVPGVTNSEGAEAGWSTTRLTLLASNGFAGSYRRSGHSLSAVAIAGEGTHMERDYDYSSVLHREDLGDPARIGQSAGERAVARLNPRKVPSCTVPVVFDPRVAGSLVRHLVSAISGPAVTRGTTFLKDRLGERVFAPGITIREEPHRARGLRSSPFDAEGLAHAERAIVEDGVLTTWLLDLASARQLGMAPTGHASRGVSGPPAPAPANLVLMPGAIGREDLLAEIDEGFYVTEMIGSGISLVTGDYSRGAAGFWIENGRLAHAVAEVTIAGNLKDMFQNLRAASDLELRYGIDSPTLRVDGLTVAGQ